MNEWDSYESLQDENNPPYEDPLYANQQYSSLLITFEHRWYTEAQISFLSNT